MDVRHGGGGEEEATAGTWDGATVSLSYGPQQFAHEAVLPQHRHWLMFSWLMFQMQSEQQFPVDWVKMNLPKLEHP
jgi:hypothetical protein